MQSRREGENSEAINDDLFKFNWRKYHSTDSPDSSDEYEEDTRISYQFRRWANHIWTVSTNVTSRLRDLLGNHAGSNTTSDQSAYESCEDESNATNWNTSSSIIESSNRINNEYCNTGRCRYEQNHLWGTPREKFSGYGQKFNHVTEGRRMHHVPVNRVEISPNFMYPPVLILPRLHRGTNRQVVDTGVYQSQKHMFKYHDMRSPEYADGWYRRYRNLGKCWGYESSGCGGNYSTSLGRHWVPDELIDNRRVKDRRRIPMRSKRNTESTEYGFTSVKRFSTRIRDFHSKSYGNDRESVSGILDTRQPLRRSFPKSWKPRCYGNNVSRRGSNRQSKSTIHTKAKNVPWDLRVSDITSQELHFENQSSIGLSAKSSITLGKDEKKTIVDSNSKSAPAPLEDDTKNHESAVPPVRDTSALDLPKIAEDIRADENNNQRRNNDPANSKGIEWSSVTENSVDLLLQSLRERMDTLVKFHSLDTETISDQTGRNRTGEINLTKDCIVASCLAGSYFPQCLDGENKAVTQCEVKNEEIRPSFSDRIQEIWRDGRPGAWRSSPRHQTSSIRFEVKSEKNQSSKLSLLGLNQQPVLREYFGECNNAFGFARIFEKFIDSKAESDADPSTVSQRPKPPPRLSRKQSKTCIRVNVGIQKSTPTTTASSQDQTSYPRRRLTEKKKSRKNFKKNLKTRVLKFPVQTPRPLQIFTGQSIVPISSIQFAQVDQPVSNFSGFSQPRLDAGSSINCYGGLSAGHGHSIIIDNPVFREANDLLFADTGLKCSPFLSNLDSTVSARGGSSFTMEEERLTLHGIKSLNDEKINREVISERERILSFVLGKIERKRQRAQQLIAQNTDVTQQHALRHSTPVQLQESRVIDDGEDSTLSRGSAKGGCSWWKKKFHFNKGGTFKRKMAFILGRVNKRHPDSGKDDLVKTQDGTVAPVAPARFRRRSNVRSTKINKSIQWEFDGNVSRSVQKIDSFQVTEYRRSNKSTLVDAGIRRVFVANGTNTNLKKSHKKTTTTLNLMQNAEALASPEILQASEQDCNDSSSKLPAPDRTSIDTSIVADAMQKSELCTNDKPSFIDASLPVQEKFGSSTDTHETDVRDSVQLSKSKVPRSSSSKIPLAKSMSPSNVPATISVKRPSTAPILENSSSDSSRSNVFLGEFDVEKGFGRELMNHEATKKMLFKHNRSSLLRANNSIARKSAMKQSNLSRKSTLEKNMVTISISKALTSSVKIDEEKAPLRPHPIEETRCDELVPEKHLDGNEADIIMKCLPSKDANLTINKFPEAHSTSSISECSTKVKIVEKISSSNTSGAFSPKTEDLAHDKEIINLSTPLPRPHLIDQYHSLNRDVRNPLGDGRSLCRNLEQEDKRSPKGFSSPLNVALQVGEGKEMPISNRENTDLKEGKRLHKTYSMLCDIVSNVKFKRDEKLPTQLTVNMGANLESVGPKELREIEPNKSCLSISNASKPQSDEQSFFTENTRVEDQSESSFASEVEIDELKTTLNEKAEFQSQDVYSTSTDSARKLALRNREINTRERSRGPCFQSKTIPSSTLSPQHSIGKSGVKGARLLCKNVVPPSATGSKFCPVSNGCNADLPKVTGSIDGSQMATVKVPETHDLDLVLRHKPARTGSQVTKSTKKSKQQVTKICKPRNKNVEEILEVVFNVVDMAINESTNARCKTNLEMISPRRSICQVILSNSEKLSETYVDPLKPIQLRNTFDEVDAGSSQSSSSNRERELERLCFAKQPSSTSEPNDYEGMQSLRKSLGANEPFVITSEVSAPSNENIPKVLKDAEFQIPCRVFDQTTGHDGKFEVTIVSPEIVTDEEIGREMPFGTEYHLTQTTVAFDFEDIANKPEKLRLLMSNSQLESSIKFRKSEQKCSAGEKTEKKRENRKLFDTDANSRVMDDEFCRKSSKGGRNVMINNKVLKKKVKCSIENGVPLKTITITNPSIIKGDCPNNEKLCSANEITHDKDLPKEKSTVQYKLPKKFHKNSQNPRLDVKSERQSSHTECASRETENSDMANKAGSETPSKPENIESSATKDLERIIDKSPRTVDENNLISNMTESDKTPRKWRGTLIPRYTKIPSSSQVCKTLV